MKLTCGWCHREILRESWELKRQARRRLPNGDRVMTGQHGGRCGITEFSERELVLEARRLERESTMAPA